MRNEAVCNFKLSIACTIRWSLCEYTCLFLLLLVSYPGYGADNEQPRYRAVVISFETASDIINNREGIEKNFKAFGIRPLVIKIQPTDNWDVVLRNSPDRRSIEKGAPIFILAHGTEKDGKHEIVKKMGRSGISDSDTIPSLDIIDSVSVHFGEHPYWFSACWAGYACDNLCSRYQVGTCCGKHEAYLNPNTGTDFTIDAIVELMGNKALATKWDKNHDGQIDPTEMTDYFRDRFGSLKWRAFVTETWGEGFEERKKKAVADFKAKHSKAAVTLTGDEGNFVVECNDTSGRTKLALSNLKFKDLKSAESWVKSHNPNWPSHCIDIKEGENFIGTSGEKLTDCRLQETSRTYEFFIEYPNKASISPDKSAPRGYSNGDVYNFYQCPDTGTFRLYLTPDNQPARFYEDRNDPKSKSH